MAEAGMPWTPEDPWWVRDNLREAIDRLVDLGYTVRGGQAEDPELIDPGGSAVETWREDYPYEERMSREEYEAEKYRLQVELLKFQYWGQDHGLKNVIVFEGRDAAGKGGTINASPNIWIPARPGPSRWANRRTANRASGISSGTFNTCQRPVRS